MVAKNTMPSVHQVADYFLLKIDASAGDSITNLKLQKMCYFAQAIFLGEDKGRLFEEEVQAWAHGPVIPDLYQRFKEYSWQSIDPTDLVEGAERLNGNHAPLLDDIWSAFSIFSAKQLEKLTHEHSPWRDAYGGTPFGGACQTVIEPDVMKAFYGQEEQKKWWKDLVKQAEERVSESRI